MASSSDALTSGATSAQGSNGKSTSSATNHTLSRRDQVMTGELPGDFLRITADANQQQILADHQTAAYLQAQQSGTATGRQAMFAHPVTRLSITVCQAKLNKNYGLTKMDPYCRMRVGHSVFETPTANSGGKNPVWNKVIHAPLPAGVDSVYIEVFDERAFTMDDRVAWTHIQIPARVISGETVDEWYPLNGKLGDEKEGTINLVLSLTQVAAPAYRGQQIVYATPHGGVYSTGGHQPVVVVQGGVAPGLVYPGQMPGQIPQPIPQHQQPMPPVPQGPAFTDEDIAKVQEMFPDVDLEVIRSLMEVNRGDKDATINNLLAMEPAS